MTKEEQQFNKWFDEYAGGVKVFEEVDMKQAYLQGRAELELELTVEKDLHQEEINLHLHAEDYIKSLEKENEELKEQIKQIEKVSDYNADQLTKATEILQTVFDKWKEERWILQSEKEVKQIENLMKQAEQFIKDLEK